MKLLLGNYVGIILKKHERSQHTLVLFDSVLGKIDAIFTSMPIVHGAVLQYQMRERFGRYFIDNFEIIDVPIMQTHNDILFFHHILEICFYFLPMGDANVTIFNLLSCLYATDRIIWNDQYYKQLFLFKLLTLIGVYDEHPILRKSSIERLISMSIDNMVAQPIDLECQKDILHWIRICVFGHPDIDNFKTTSFLCER
jgi:hypothetical protein